MIRFRTPLVLLSAAAALSLLAGCGMGVQDTSATGTFHLTGNVHGGQQAVVGSRIQLYDAGTGGNGTAATDRLILPVYSVQYGNFSITGDYTCPNANDQIYIVATGGNPGLGAVNTGIVLVTALGNCGTLLANGANTFITINEVTTAAAAWALGAFATGPANVAASSTNLVGITNAMNNAALLANPTTGLSTAQTGRTIENAKVYSLANSLAACVNSATGSTICNSLFTAATPSGGTAPTDTFTAALNIVHNPATNVATIYNLAGSTPPFGGGLTTAPTDWTMSSTMNLQTLFNLSQTPCLTQIAIDGGGSVWLPDCSNDVLLAVNAQGAPLTGSPFGGTLLNDSEGVTVDTAGNVWTSNFEDNGGTRPSPNGGSGYLVRFQSSTGSAPGTAVPNPANGTSFLFDSSLDSPFIANADSNGNVIFTNGNNRSGTVYSSAGAFVASVPGQSSGVDEFLFDVNHGYWDLSYGSTVQHIANGTSTTVTASQGYNFIGATDSAGNIWLPNAEGELISAVSAANMVVVSGVTAGHPAITAATGFGEQNGVTVDAGGVVWIAGDVVPAHGSANVAYVTAVSSGTATTGKGSQAAGTSLFAAGVGTDSQAGIFQSLLPDRSGNLWVVGADGMLVEFFSLATPTQTPNLPSPTAP